MEEELNRLKGDHKMPTRELFRRTMTYVKPELPSFIIAFILLVLNVGLDILLPMITGWITDSLDGFEELFRVGELTYQN